MLFLQEALQVSQFTQLNCFLFYHGTWKWWCRSSVHFLFQPGNPYFEFSRKPGDFQWVQIWGFHASNFEAVESLSSTHVDCRNQQASEVFHGNIPLNCEILRTLDTNIFHILINWMVVLPCCVDPQLTTSHVPWGPPPHFISHHPCDLNFFHISSSQYPERGMDGLRHHLHSGKRNPSQWNPSPVFLGGDRKESFTRSRLGSTTVRYNFLKWGNPWKTHKQVLFGFHVWPVIMLLTWWCTSTYIFWAKKIGSNWLDSAFVVLSHRLEVLIDDPRLVSWLGVPPTYYIGMDGLIEKATTSLKHEFLFASKCSSFQSTVCSLLAPCRPIQP